MCSLSYPGDPNCCHCQSRAPYQLSLSVWCMGLSGKASDPISHWLLVVMVTSPEATLALICFQRQVTSWLNVDSARWKEPHEGTILPLAWTLQALGFTIVISGMVVQESLRPTGTNLPLHVPEFVCCRILQNHSLKASGDG